MSPTKLRARAEILRQMAEDIERREREAQTERRNIELGKGA